MFRRLLDIILPVSCPCCGAGLSAAGPEYICAECFSGLEIINSVGCLKCGRPLEYEGFCRRCHGSASHLDKYYTACHYTGNTRNLILNFKFKNKRYLAKPLGDILAGLWLEKDLDKFDFIVPVPLHRARQRQRGYNQAHLMALRLSEKTGVPVAARFLRRAKNTRSQTTLGQRERSINMRGVFRASTKASGLNIVLVDDVATTGSTLQNCAAALRSSGASGVSALTAAHGK